MYDCAGNGGLGNDCLWALRRRSLSLKLRYLLGLAIGDDAVLLALKKHSLRSHKHDELSQMKTIPVTAIPRPINASRTDLDCQISCDFVPETNAPGALNPYCDPAP